jgi:hypothetical protein
MGKLLSPDTGRLPKLPEAPMLYVKHRWMKNRNMLHESLVLCFDDKGLAPVEDRGDNRRMAQDACVRSQGQMTLIADEPVPVTTAAEVKAAGERGERFTPVAKPAEVSLPKVEKAEKDEVEVWTTAKDEPKPKPKKAPPKKKTTKKTVGKKSSKK